MFIERTGKARGSAEGEEFRELEFAASEIGGEQAAGSGQGGAHSSERANQEIAGSDQPRTQAQ